MKKLFSLITIFSALLVLSCSNFNNTTSVKITLNAGNARSAARDIEPDNKEAGYYIVASINGGYSEAQTQFLSWEDEECTFTFDSVPVGRKIYAELNAYWATSVEMQDNPDIQMKMPYRGPIHEYTGRSETITVTTGENFLPLELNPVDSYSGDQEWYTIYFNGTSSDADNACFIMELQYSGKYYIHYPDGPFYSEGTWRSDEPINNETFYKEGSRTIYLTEYVYGKENTQKYPAGYEEKYTTPVIVELPQENAVTIKSGGRENYSFTFTSKSGKTFTFGEDNAGGGNPEPCEVTFSCDPSKGSVENLGEDFVQPGEEVKFKVVPGSGYRVKSIVVKDSRQYGVYYDNLTVDADGYCSFRMPGEGVWVRVEFEKDAPVGFVYVEGRNFAANEMLNPESEVLTNTEGVSIPNLYVCDHEVTQGEYETYCCYGDTTYSPSDSYGLGENYPVYFVAWYDAIVYCNLRSMAEDLQPVYSLNDETDPGQWGEENIVSQIVGGITKYCGPTTSNNNWNTRITCDFTANGYRLPTEAEWEYAARGGKELKNYTYSGSGYIGDVGWYSSNIGADTGCQLVKSEYIQPNSLGIWDMSGNVCEWCWEHPYMVSETYYNVHYRGGGYTSRDTECTVFYRDNTSVDERGFTYGFRVVRTAE